MYRVSFAGVSPNKDSACVIERTEPTAISDHIISLTVPWDECAAGSRSQTERLSGYQFMNKNQINGRAKEGKGKIKEIAGKVTGDKSTEYKGKAEKYGGKAEARYGELKSDAEKATK